MKNPNSVEFDSMKQHSNYEVIFKKTRKRLNADGRIQTGSLAHPKPNALPTELTSRVGILGLNYRIRRINT